MERCLTEGQCWELFVRLFPQGLVDASVLQELAPDGWECSALAQVFHPTPEQLYQEAMRIHANIQDLLAASGLRREGPPPSLEEIRSSYEHEPIRPGEESADLLGRCLWDIFSNGHEVFTHEGVLVDLGSFRASAGFIADFCNRVQGQAGTADERKDYLDFYMGTSLVGHRADLAPVYAVIFRRLKAVGLGWRYVHPRLLLVDLSGLHELLERGEAPEWMGYDPSEAFAREQQERKRQQELAELQKSLDQGYRESIEEARRNPPPRIVQTYRKVYGHWPDGWPPREWSKS
jgi:hypothetical protein